MSEVRNITYTADVFDDVMTTSLIQGASCVPQGELGWTCSVERYKCGNGIT